jgi:hypothetical protein
MVVELNHGYGTPSTNSGSGSANVDMDFTRIEIQHRLGQSKVETDRLSGGNISIEVVESLGYIQANHWSEAERRTVIRLEATWWRQRACKRIASWPTSTGPRQK